MKRIFFLIFVICFGVSRSLAQTALTNADVLEMVKSGLSPAVIAAKIRSSQTKFDTTTDGLKKLSESNVPDSIVVAMIERDEEQKKASSSEVKENTKFVDSFPEQGTLSDIKGLKNVYISCDDLKSRDRIVKELEKSKLFEIVDKIEDSDFVIKFQIWEESVGATGNVVGTTATVRDERVRIGLFTVVMPSKTSNRIRNIYSNKQTQRSVLFDHPAEKTTKQFLKDLAKLN